MNDPTTNPENEDLLPEDQAAEAPAEATRDAEIADLKDRLLRQAAETENVRRRLDREKRDATAYAVTGFARDLLGVVDNLRRALDAIPAEARENETVKTVVTGVEMTERELVNTLARHGVTRIESQGEKLDPNRHQAMIEVEHDAEAGTIVQELQAGYMLKDRLLRPAMVSVARAK
ncbi:nucleotide exchange factor GrpE [Sphingoaurantiacus capsulatus]|uniref:Protein GrpE n=1 Tax=Sphingoaurantiacus capsulatus TaxID=1771310 RepID=A0ABV7XBT1_9SPHN